VRGVVDDRTARLFRVLGSEGAAVHGVHAPGRVNLIGDHTDYCEGFVLPLAINRDCVVVWAPRSDGRVVIRSLEVDGEVDIAADGSDEPQAVEPAWGRFAAGVVRALAVRGRAPFGFTAALSSNVPVGAGLSSSSALAVGLTLAAADAGKLHLDRVDAARAALEAEVVATGVPGGLMDQLASLFGRREYALLIDCRDLSVDLVPLPRTHVVLAVHSGLPRVLAASAYAQRRAACEAAAARLGVRSLRDARAGQVAEDPRARHVVSENMRVLDAAAALRAGDVDTVGRLMTESHASLRDDFEVSTPELDLLVELLVAAGAVGARLTGAGFGGCVVALVQRNHADDVAARTVLTYEKETGRCADAFVAQAVDGAGAVDL
jgi:galactokinase